MAVQTAGVLILGTQESQDQPGKSGTGVCDATLRSRLACVDVLGRSVLLRTLDRLKAAGIEPVTILSNAIPDIVPRNNLRRIEDELPFQLRPVIEQFAQDGAKLLVCLRLGPYAEIDFWDLLQFHSQKKASYTTAYHEGRKLPVFVTDLNRPSQAASALIDWLEAEQIPCARFAFHGYVNWLEDLEDFRRLAREGLLRRCELDPVGRERRPGVWIAPGARISSEARLVAPVYIGAGSVIRKRALVTRCSNIEAHCEVESGTTVEDATLFPGTLVGPGLQLCNVVVQGSILHDLRRQVSIAVEDTKLLADNSAARSGLNKMRNLVPALLGRSRKAPTAT